MFGNKPAGGFSFGNASTFGQSTPFAAGNTTFGTAKPTGTAFGTPGGGVFGAATPTATPGGGLFGQQSTSTGGGGLFGSAQPQQTGFGQSAGFTFGATPAASNSGGLFGQPTATQSGGGLFSAPATNNAFGAKQAGFGGFGATTATPGGGMFGHTPNTSLFGHAGTSGFGGAVPTGTTLKYNPPASQDTMVKNGQTRNIFTRHQCITAMNEYQSKSLEELIMEDYAANRKGKQPGTGGTFGTTPAATQSAAFNFGAIPANTGSPFGPQTAATGGTTLFGAQPQSAAAGMFGHTNKPLFGTATTSSGGRFGTSTSTGTPSLFGAQDKELRMEDYAANRKRKQPGTGGMFGTTPATTQSAAFNFGAMPANTGSPTTSSGGGFGTNTSTGSPSLFGAQDKPLFGGTPAATTQSTLFGGTGTTGVGASTGFGGFGTSTSTGTSLFGANKPAFGTTPVTSITGFDQLNLFGANKPAETGLFGTPVQTPGFESTMATATVCDHCHSSNVVNTSVSWCMECEEELCFECAEYHTKHKMARNHHVVDLKLKTSYSALLKKSSLVCEQHKDCDVEYFCVDHDELCCRECLAKTHKSCVNTMSVDSASKGAKQSQLFYDCQEQLTSINQTYKSILKYREENVNGIKDDKEKIKENMKKLKKKLIQRLNEVEKELTNKLDILVQENTKFQQDEISKVLDVTEEVELYLKEMLFIIEHGSEKQAFLLCRKIDKYLHQADNELQTTTSQLKRVTLSFDESNDLLSSIKTFGDVTVNKIIDHTITHKILKEQQAQFVLDKGTTMSTFKLQNRIEGTGRGITGMVVTDDDHLLLCDVSCVNSELVTVYYPSGKYMKRIDVSYPPWDIAIIPRTHRAVVTFTNKKIQFINLQTFTQDDKLITIPNSTAIYGITATSDNIIVGDTRMIHCLDIEGIYLRTITLSTGSNTRHLSIGHNNQIYYTNRSSINCVNWDGTEVFSYTIPNEENHKKIAIDRNGKVYVTGYGTNTIQRLHSDGTVDCVVLNKGDEVKRSGSVCFNKNCDKLYMANNDSRVVHVYSCS